MPSTRWPRRRASSSTKPTGLQREARVAHDLAQDEPAAVAGADDQDPARVLARPEAAGARVVEQARGEARPRDHRQRQQEEQDQDAERDVHRGEALVAADLHGVRRGHEGREAQRRDDDRLGDRHVVAPRHVAPPLLVEPEQDEDHHARDDRPDDRAVQQQLVAMRDARVEPQAVGELIGERDHDPVHGKLRERVAVERKGRRAEASAHRRRHSRAQFRMPAGDDLQR